jgi:hypothetical protein
LKHFFKIALFIIYNLTFIIYNSHAQTYPINLTSQLLPPFSGYLPDYSAAGTDKLRLLLLFNDFTKPAYNVKLKLKITGQGITIESKPQYYDGPYSVEPGVPMQLSGSDLAGLLNINSLDFSGISKSQYEQRKVLPEGFYSFCITAYDYNNPNPIKVSNESCAYGMMVLSDPPYLNLPGCGASLPVLNPQQITFNWTPINQASPNSAGQTDYALELFEVRPAGQNPNNIVQSLPPIFTETISTTSFNYGLTEPPLIMGMEYVWRVRAIDQSGRDAFKNQGYSQICTFTWGSQYTGANLAINLAGVPLTHKQVKCTWDSLNLYTNYKLEFKKVGGTPTWFPVNTANARTRITGLEPNTDYLIHVTGQLPDGSWGPQSNEITLHTPNTPIYGCGDPSPAFNTQNFAPLTQAANYQLWDIGQFEVLVTGLDNYQSPTGQYTGKGRVILGFAGAISFPVTFNNITVSDEMRVVAGKVDVRNNGIGTIVNVDDVISDITNWFNDFNTTHDTVALVNNLQQACNQAQQSGDSTFINAFNDLLPIASSQNSNNTLFCSSDNKAVMQYIASNPSAVSNWQGNINTLNSSAGGIYCAVNDNTTADLDITLNNDFIVLAEEMVIKRYKPEQNLKDIWGELSSDLTVGYKYNNNLKKLFPATDTWGQTQDKFCQFLQLLQLLWEDNFTVQYLHGTKGFQQERSKIIGANSTLTKANAILARHNITRTEWQKWEIIGSNLTEWFAILFTYSDGGITQKVIKKRNIKFSNANYNQGQNIGKIIKGSAQEIADAKIKIQNYRISTNAGNGGNFGYLEGTVNNTLVDNKLWRSISINNAKNEIHIFTAIESEGAGGNSWLRITDSEYRMLNKLANDLGGVKGNVYNNVTGTLKIISENPYCKSCTGIIQEFHEMFPKLNLILIEGVK